MSRRSVPARRSWRLFAVVAAFTTYFAMYAFRKPFVAASFELDDRPGPVRDFVVQGQRDWADTLAGAARIVNLGPPKPSAIDSWMGISNASWDGDTLVVDVSGFNGQAWLDRGRLGRPEVHDARRPRAR